MEDSASKLPGDSLLGKAILTEEVTHYFFFFFKVILFSTGLMGGRWRVTSLASLARQSEPEAGRVNKGLCSHPGCCSRKLLCQAPEWEQCPCPRGTENALKGQASKHPAGQSLFRNP